MKKLIRFNKKAVSSKVSVPCVITKPSILSSFANSFINFARVSSKLETSTTNTKYL